MLNNLLGPKNVPANGGAKSLGEEKGEEMSFSEKQQQAANALGNLLGARLNKPPPSIMLPQIPESGTSSAAANNYNHDATNTTGRVPLNKDPRFEKYFRMLKVGMPMPHVKHAMQRDGLNPDILDQDPTKPFSSMNTGKNPTRQPRSKKKKPSGPRRARFRWNKISNFFTESIWGDLSDDETVRSLDIDEQEFVELFQAQEEPEASNRSAVQRASMISLNKKKNASAVRVIDAKRANNGGISLARIKMSFDEVSRNVDKMVVGTLAAGQIENMIEYLPTKEEEKRLTEYMLDVEKEEDLYDRFNSLCECEKFMVSIMTVKHPKEKLDAMHFQLDFQASLDAIAQDAELVDKACDELRNSTSLKKLLGIVLEFGNKLNTAAQGPEDKANAFALDSLLKLKQTKAFDKKTTFLNYIVSIVERNDESLLDFAKDIQTVIKAEKVYWDVCVSELEKVETQVENLRRMALYEAQELKDTDGTTITLPPNSIQVPEDKEFETLQSTATGRFTIDAMKQLSQLHLQVDSTVDKFQNLLIYFGEDNASTPGGKRPKRPHELFSIFSQFSRDFEEARPVKKRNSFTRKYSS